MDKQTSVLKTLLPVFILLLLVLSATTSLIVFTSFSRSYRSTIRKNLVDQIRIIQMSLPEGPVENNTEAIRSIVNQYRTFETHHLTIMRFNGDVIADSRNEAWHRMNQVNQPEVASAINRSDHIGFFVRKDPDTDRNAFYLAKQIRDDNGNIRIIRVGIPGSLMVAGLPGVIGLIVLASVIVSIAIGLFTFNICIKPVNIMRQHADALAGNVNDKWKVRNEQTAELEKLGQSLQRMVKRFRDHLERETEQRKLLETMFRSMVDPVFVVDKHSQIQRYNKAFVKLLHIETHDISGRPVLEVIRSTKLNGFVEKTLATLLPVEEEIDFHNHYDLFFKVTGVSIDGGDGTDGTVIGAMIVMNNVTRIRKLERIRTDFVANVSHELKTPITAIRGFVETLLDGAVNQPEDATRFLKIISKQVNQLQAVIEDLLSLSRLEQEKTGNGNKLEPIQLVHLFQSAVQMCDSAARERNISIEIVCEGINIAVNRTLLLQAIINLLENAVKYGATNSVVNLFGFVKQNAVLIQVKDSGPGISKEHLERIFERFYRVDKSRSRDMGGSGLGLSIVKHIAQIHGGTVSVQSVPGKGSVFTIELPVTLLSNLPMNNQCDDSATNDSDSGAT